jgi:hypothetical protein
MPLLKWHQVVYAVNLSLLITHEIDSAYWQEWNLFGVPGGIQLFLILNLILILMALYGYSSLLRNQWSGYVISVLVFLAGIFAFSIHLYFIILGHPEFTLPLSEVILVFILLVSLLQATLFVFIVKEKRTSAT